MRDNKSEVEIFPQSHVFAIFLYMLVDVVLLLKDHCTIETCINHRAETERQPLKLTFTSKDVRGLFKATISMLQIHQY